MGFYYTNLNYGEIDFAIIEDRKFKSGPRGKIPQQGPRPDHILNPNYNPEDIDLDGLQLLGERQLYFLKNWSKNNIKIKMKAVTSVSITICTTTQHFKTTLVSGKSNLLILFSSKLGCVVISTSQKKN